MVIQPNQTELPELLTVTDFCQRYSIGKTSFYREVNAHNLRDAHNRGLSVIVWTVNDEPEMIRLIELGVDGVISDYPDRLREVASSLGLELPQPTVVQP